MHVGRVTANTGCFAMFERIRAFLEQWKELKEVAELSDRDLDDLGLTRDQLQEFIRIPHDAPDRMAAMAALFGVTEAQLREDHGEYLELLTTCGHCVDRAACALVLDKGELARPSDCAFCPNSRAFAAKVPRAAA